MYEVDQNQDPYREGLLARALGRSCDRNPYPEHSREASLWIHGWWLIQEATVTPPAEEFECEPPSRPGHVRFEDPWDHFLERYEDEPVVYSLGHAVETMRPLLTGLLLAAAGFWLSYSILRVFLL
jgi:hypothetical protein